MKLIRQNITLDNWRKIYLLLQKIMLEANEYNINNESGFRYDKSYVTIPIKNFGKDELKNIYTVTRIVKDAKKLQPSNPIALVDVLDISRRITDYNNLKEYDTFFYVLYNHQTNRFTFGITSSYMMGYLKRDKHVKQLYEVNIYEDKQETSKNT